MTTFPPDMAPPRTRRGVFFIVLKMTLSAGLLAWILSRPELDALGPLMAGVDTRWLLAGFACAGLSVWLLAWRWQACLHAVGLRLPMAEVFRITLAASAAGYFSVGTLGADTAKVFLVARRAPGSHAAVTGSLAIDHASSTPAMVVLLMLALGPHGLMPAFEKHAAWTVAGGALAIMAGGLVLRWKWGHIHDRILNFLTGRETWRGFVTGVWRSFPLWTAYCGVFYCAARAFGVHLPFLSFAGVSAIADAVASLPISVAGLGVREQAFQSLLSLWHGVPPASSVALSLAGFVLFLSWAAIGAACLFTEPARPRLNP
jgi:uncharacterized membrane protein YbhN (UPF0104 family)